MPNKKIALVIAFLFICSQAIAKEELRVVSLAPSITETLFALGLNSREIVGVTDYCNYPKGTEKILKIGSLTTVSIEKIISLAPDHVFSVGQENGSLNTNLRKAGLKITVLNPESIEDTMAGILEIGKILKKEDKAKKIISDMKHDLKRIKNNVAKIKNKKRIYVEIWDDPITSCGRHSLVNEVVTAAGAINITGGISSLYPSLNQEFIIKKNPDVILLGYMSRNQENTVSSILNRYGWQDINAVKTKNIICDIDPNIFLRAGPRIVEGVERIYRRLYPKVYEDK